MNQSARKEYTPRQSTDGATTSSLTQEERGEDLALEDWDKWFETDLSSCESD